MTTQHAHGTSLLFGSGITASWAWYLANQQLINGTIYTVVLLVTLVGGIVGLRKVLKR